MAKACLVAFKVNFVVLNGPVFKNPHVKQQFDTGISAMLRKSIFTGFSLNFHSEIPEADSV